MLKNFEKCHPPLIFPPPLPVPISLTSAPPIPLAAALVGLLRVAIRDQGLVIGVLNSTSPTLFGFPEIREAAE